RMDPEGQSNGSVDHRVVLAPGRADIGSGTSLARSRLNLAKVLDGLERLRLPAFVVGPPPSRDGALTPAVRDLASAYADVCSRRRIPYVDMVGGLEGHEQWDGDIVRSPGDHPGQTGYGLMAWLVLHGGFGTWLGTSAWGPPPARRGDRCLPSRSRSSPAGVGESWGRSRAGPFPKEGERDEQARTQAQGPPQEQRQSRQAPRRGLIGAPAG